jgi:hypothetical protein
MAAVVAIGSAAGGGYIALRGTTQPAYASGPPVPLLGSSVRSMADLGTDTAQFGRMPIVRVYYPGLPHDNAWNGGLAGANHSAVIVSFKAQPDAILSGADDAVLRHFFATAPTGHPIYYCYYHEPEDNIEAGQFRLPDYLAAWHRVVALADAAHNPWLHSTLILMSWDLVKASHRNWRDYLPSGHIISTLGWDAYPVGSATNQNPQLEPPTSFMGPAIAAARSVGLPYGFPEFGLSRANGRPGWLTETGRYIMHSGALFASLFNGNDQYPTLRLTDQPSVAVWRQFVAASRSGPPVPWHSPPPSPSPTSSGPSGGQPPVTAMVSGLSLRPAAVTMFTERLATLTFSLSRRADITVCVLDRHGHVTRLLARPGRRAGPVTVRYLSSQRVLPPGQYAILVVASNSRGSGTAEATLTVSPHGPMVPPAH